MLRYNIRSGIVPTANISDIANGRSEVMLSITEKIGSLKETELFSNASETDLEGFAKIAQELHLSDGQTVFHAGDKGDAIYFVVNGQVRIHKSGVELVRRGAGECIGEMAVMDEEPRSASMSSIGNSLLLKVDREDFYNAVQGNARLIQNVLKTVVTRFREDIDRQVDATREKERMMQDLTRARELQMSMLPTEDLLITTADGASLEASGNCNPAEMVGGDYYDYCSLPGQRVGLVIGDVMGHGFHTGLMVSTAKSCLYTQVKADCCIPSVMSAMNDMVFGFVHSDLFMTFCYIIVDLQTRTMSFSNAGHSYPYHYRASTKQLDMLESEACPLGILEYQQFETSQSEWDNGDIIVLYTDGIIEAQNGEKEDFGEEKLKQLIMDNVHLSPVKLKETILHKLESFCQGTDQADDVSLVIVKMGARND